MNYKSPSGVEVRGGMDSVDEIVAEGPFIHLEMMSEGYAWMKVGTVSFNISIKGRRLVITAEEEGRLT